MINRARWILIGAAMMVLGGVFAWSCGGGGSSTQCVLGVGGIPIIPCGVPSPPGPSLESISICPGTAPPPTPVSTTTASPLPTPMETTCPQQIITAVPTAGINISFHAVGSFNNGTTQDITNNSTTSWTSSNLAVAVPNSSPAGSYFAAGAGCATINANSGSISGSPPPVVDVAPIPSGCPTP
jgi:hypothetical protein